LASVLLASLSLSGAESTATPDTALAPSSPTQAVIQLDTLEVTASQPSSPVESTPLKLPVSLHETPRSVTVIDAARIREQNFRTPVDTFYYTPGIFPNSTASGGYHYIARGFRMSPDETRIDGFTGFYVGGGQSAQNLYGVERVVTLRGPAGLLYGASSLPGGLVNIITKKPSAEASTRIETTTTTYAGNGLNVGDRTSLGFELDSTGPLTPDGRVLYRGILAGDDTEVYTGDVLNQTRYYNGALTFLLDPEGRTTFTPLVQISQNTRPAGAAMVMSPSTSLSTNDGSNGPINENDLSPLDVNLYGGGRTDDMYVAGFDFQSKPADAFTFNAGYRYIAYRTEINQWTPVVTTLAQRTQLATLNTVSRTQAKSSTERDSHNVDVNGTYEFEPASWWKNLTQLGVNARALRTRVRTGTGPNAPQSPINIYTGQSATPLVDNLVLGAPVLTADEANWNTYLQNQAAFLDERWILTLGVGYGEQNLGTAAPGARNRPGEVTPNAALVFNLTKQLALYASFSTSYSPADPTQENFAGTSGTFDPQTGVNREIGLKYDLPDRRASVSLALFETERDNVIVQDTSLGPVNGNGNPYYIQQGGQSARGVELGSEVYVTRNWRFNGSFAYIDASYENGTAFAEPVAKTPEYSWSLFTRYDFTDGPLKDLGASLGVVWQDERLGGNAARTATTPDPLMLPSFFRLDAGLFYRLGRHWDFALNVENLLDETIFVDGTTGANLQIAAPRTVTLRVGYKF
jgi:iron complex outermembrane receptor protein